MRVAVLWTHLSGYMNVCLRALAAQGDELYVSSIEPDEGAPFDRNLYSWLNPKSHAEWRKGGIKEAVLMEMLERFHPDVMLVAGWSVREYARAAAPFRARAVRVLAMDNPWRGSLRQMLGVATAPWYVRPYYDAIFVPGERQFQFARKLGFPESRILRGLLVADQPSFSRAADETTQRDRTFAYVGRLAPEKGIKILVDGYVKYRDAVEKPWPLVIFGAGPLRKLVEGVEHVEGRGFIQPAALPAVLARQGCLILPSLSESWALVIHEAAAAGLPIICTSSCGASVHLVCDGYNGLIIEPGNSEILAGAMGKLSSMPEADLVAAGRASRVLAEQFTPRRWAAYFRDRVSEIAGFSSSGKLFHVGN